MAKEYTHIAKTILLYLAVAGVVSIGGISPYAVINHLLRNILKDKDYREAIKERRKFSQAVYRLQRSQLIIVKEKEAGTFLVELTERGKRKTKEVQFANLKIAKPKKWDKIWRIVIFDIPDQKKNAREALREKLIDLGFCQLQKSVWAFPYPCKTEIEFIVEFYDLYPYIHRVEATHIQNDAKLRKRFHLL